MQFPLSPAADFMGKAVADSSWLAGDEAAAQSEMWCHFASQPEATGSMRTPQSLSVKDILDQCRRKDSSCSLSKQTLLPKNDGSANVTYDRYAAEPSKADIEVLEDNDGC